VVLINLQALLQVILEILVQILFFQQLHLLVVVLPEELVLDYREVQVVEVLKVQHHQVVMLEDQVIHLL